jgi:hypothetical protein
MILASSAGAEECVVNGNPVSPATLASELEAGFGSLPGQLAGVPFSVVSGEQLSINWTGCAEDCIYSTGLGESQCGNLVATPVESLLLREVAGVPDPLAQAAVTAGQSPNGKWNILADAFVDPYWSETSKSASFDFELGTREVIDVSGSAGAKPLDIHLRGGSRLPYVEVGCIGDLFHWVPSQRVRFRVTERTTFTTLVNTVYWDPFYSQTEVFTINVENGWVLQIDLHYEAFANATGAQEPGGEYCDGGYVFLDAAGPPDRDGLQLFLDPDPSLTLTPRSGIVYEAPEPDAGAAWAFAIALLIGRKRLT